MGQHKNITDPELHEPKGVASADADTVYIADGAGSGAWDTPVADQVKTGWRDLIMPFTASNAGTLSAPTFVKVADDAGPGGGGATTGVYGYSFSASSEEELFMNFHIDHDYKVGTAFYPHIHWCSDGTDTGTVRWGIEWSYAIRNDTTPVTLSATTTTYIEQAATGTAYQHMVAEVADPGITIPNAAVDMIVTPRPNATLQRSTEPCVIAKSGKLFSNISQNVSCRLRLPFSLVLGDLGEYSPTTLYSSPSNFSNGIVSGCFRVVRVTS